MLMEFFLELCKDCRLGAAGSIQPNSADACAEAGARVGVGLWFTFGPGGKKIKDPIAEHARMHELGIAHKHD